MKQEAKKRFSPAELTDALQAQANAAILADLDLWPELRQELKRRKEPERVLAGVLVGDYERWMEETLEPDQIGVMITCYKGHEQEAADALHAAFAAAGISEQLLDVILPTKMGKAEDGEQPHLPVAQYMREERAGKGSTEQARLHVFESQIMAKVARTVAAAAVVRNGPGGMTYAGWKFNRVLGRRQGTPEKDRPGEIPFKLQDRVRVFAWPFAGFAARVGNIDKKKAQVWVQIDYSGQNYYLCLDLKELEKEPEMKPMAAQEPERAWYVLHGYPGKEDVLRDNLRQRLFDAGLLDRLHDIVIPAEVQDPITLVKDGKVHSVYPTQFPGVVFVLMSLNDKAWNVIRQTPGLTGFVGQESRPLAYHLAPTSRKPPGQGSGQSEPGAEGKPPAQPGDKVRILSGPFYDLRGVVLEVDEARGKLRVMIDIFNRSTPVEIGFDQVEKV